MLEKVLYALLAHCLIPPRLSSFLHAFRIITPAQYCISWGSFGGAFGKSDSLALGRNVKRSTKEKTLVWRTGWGLGDDVNAL